MAEDFGVDEVQAELLPDQKVAIIRQLTTAGKRVAMVGDGVNDAPALVEIGGQVDVRIFLYDRHVLWRFIRNAVRC